MRNGHDSSGAPVQMQVNPQQAAQFALTFMARADMKPGEREAYSLAEGMLNAIMTGQVILAPPAPPVAPPEAPANERESSPAPVQ